MVLHHFWASGPGVNRTRTYGFGGHRPIHWTTGPDTHAGRTQPVSAPLRFGKDKDCEILSVGFSAHSTAERPASWGIGPIGECTLAYFGIAHVADQF